MNPSEQQDFPLGSETRGNVVASVGAPGGSASALTELSAVETEYNRRFRLLQNYLEVLKTGIGYTFVSNPSGQPLTKVQCNKIPHSELTREDLDTLAQYISSGHNNRPSHSLRALSRTLDPVQCLEITHNLVPMIVVRSEQASAALAFAGNEAAAGAIELVRHLVDPDICASLKPTHFAE